MRTKHFLVPIQADKKPIESTLKTSLKPAKKRPHLKTNETLVFVN